MISDDKSNFPHTLLLTNRQVANLRKAFANIYQLILNDTIRRISW